MPNIRAVLLWAVFAAVLVLLARGLPQRTFVLSDPTRSIAPLSYAVLYCKT
jgi:hypothetical protein